MRFWTSSLSRLRPCMDGSLGEGGSALRVSAYSALSCVNDRSMAPSSRSLRLSSTPCSSASPAWCRVASRVGRRSCRGHAADKSLESKRASGRGSDSGASPERRNGLDGNRRWQPQPPTRKSLAAPFPTTRPTPNGGQLTGKHQLLLGSGGRPGARRQRRQLDHFQLLRVLKESVVQSSCQADRQRGGGRGVIWAHLELIQRRPRRLEVILVVRRLRMTKVRLRRGVKQSLQAGERGGALALNFSRSWVA